MPCDRAGDDGGAFTPGPWTADHEDLSSKVRSHDGTMLAMVHQYRKGGVDAPERFANARLIAAAPELLAACLEFVRKVDAGEAKSTKSYAQMKAAIAKAVPARKSGAGHDR